MKRFMFSLFIVLCLCSTGYGYDINGDLAVTGDITEGGHAVPNDTDGLDFFVSTTSAELRGVLSDETGTGAAFFAGGALGEATATSLDVSGQVDAGTLTINSGSITDSSAAISFGDENLTTTGTVEGGVVTQNGETVVDESNPVYQVNLLTNSGFGVWSNSEDLYDAGTGAVPVVTGADAALVAGGSLVSNGGFDSVTIGWTDNNSTLSSVASGETGNCLQVEDDGASAYATQSVTTVIGKLYEASVNFKKGTATEGLIRIGISAGSVAYYDSDTITDAAWAAYSVVFEATTTTTVFTLYSVGADGGETSFYDTVTLNEVTPGIVSAAATGSDGYAKSGAATLKIYRQHWDDGTLTQDGSFYSLKLVASATGTGFQWPLGAISTLSSFYSRFAGKTVTVGYWCKTSTADLIRPAFYDGSTVTAGDYHTGGGAWEWLEFTYTFGATITTARLYLMRSNEAAGTAYISQPMLVFGSSIGEGNYVQPLGEIVWLEKEVDIHDTTTPQPADDKILNIEALSEGKLPKGIRAINMEGSVKSSSVNAGEGVRLSPTSAISGFIMWLPMVNSIEVFNNGSIRCDSNGDVYQQVTETSDVLTAYGVRALSVQVTP